MKKLRRTKMAKAKIGSSYTTRKSYVKRTKGGGVKVVKGGIVKKPTKKK
jgi:hypothetical protein